MKNTVYGLLLVSVLAASTATAVTDPAPLLPVPNAAQLRWHKAEYIMFAHFGMKTFYPSGDHKGNGLEEPARFNPVKLDANQWVEAAKAGGFKGIVLTAKHHDGFCNWATELTDHSVRSAAWKDGKGDVVRELADACRKGGVYFGIYVSIIDDHFARFGSPGHASYGDFYFDQLKELSTKYGAVDEYWFDGFNAANLKMDYPRIGRMIAETQPNAVVYDSGMLVRTIPDRCVAWPGHHGGLAAEQEYVRKIDGVDRWYPNEASIILQGNWFNTGQPSVGVRQMQDLYLASTGVGSTPLMNIPPNRDGLIDADTVAKLTEFKAWVDALHSNDLARSPGVKASDAGHRGNAEKFSAAKAVDGDYDTYFATDDGVTNAAIEITFPEARKIGGFILQEYIPLGQRVDDYAIECRVDGQWREVFSGKRIGFKRIILEGRSAASAISFNEGNVDVLKLKADRTADGKVRFPVADAVRLKIRGAKACPLINNFQVIAPLDAGAKSDWQVVSASYEVPPGGSARNAIDGDPGSLWHTHGTDGERAPPQEIIVDMGRAKTLAGFTYLPRQDGTLAGMVDQYAFFTSADGKAWTQAAEGEFAGLRENRAVRSVPFAATQARYFKFVARHALEKNHAVVAELDVIEAPRRP